MALRVEDKEAQKLRGVTGEGWLRSPDGQRVIRIAAADESLHAKWVTVTDAELINRAMQIPHNRRMLRFNAEQLWWNRIRTGWRRVPKQW